ncbi:hypothetical protein ACIRYZ_23770 [Kitasatospora sp. NPDC101155]|uniref:hypothetical protein n=1 Tax=Kitasatospora sp. NPDC101155 TaxID=3364097 RepID=UPI003825D06F
MHDLAAALNRTGRSMPGELSLYHDYDPQPLTAQFTAYLVQLREGDPLGTVEQNAAAALVGEWLGGMLPDTYLAVSPHRLQHQVELINDWLEDEVTTTVKALLPDWVAFLAHSANLPQRAIDAALTTLATLQAGTRDSAHCPGIH